MKIAFLGTGRMGTELARHLLKDHEVTVWNRTAERAQPLVDEGATQAATPQDAVKDAEVIITSLFGPDDVREAVIKTDVIPAGIPWIDTTTVSPAAAREFAEAVPTYVHAPVVGSLGPARAGELGVYVGGANREIRDLAVEIARPWAHPDKLIPVDSGAAAATGKLLANMALSVMAEGVKEALALGDAEGFGEAEVLDMLSITGLNFMATMKGPFIRGERSTDPGDFTVDALCKDSKLMVATANEPLPAVEAAIARFEHQQKLGHGNEDFSSIFVHKD